MIFIERVVIFEVWAVLTCDVILVLLVWPFGASWGPRGHLKEILGPPSGILEGILGALPPKKPPRIPNGGPKSSPTWPQEAPGGPKTPQKEPKRVPRDPQNGLRGHPNNPKNTFKSKLRKTSKMTTISMKINDFLSKKLTKNSQKLSQNKENRGKRAHHGAKSRRRAPSSHPRAQKGAEKEAGDHLAPIHGATLAPGVP